MAHFLTSLIEVYLEGMSHEGAYADNVCLQAMSRMLSAEIHIIHADSDNVVLHPLPGHYSLKVVVGYLPDIQHYVSLEPR